MVCQARKRALIFNKAGPFSIWKPASQRIADFLAALLCSCMARKFCFYQTKGLRLEKALKEFVAPFEEKNLLIAFLCKLLVYKFIKSVRL